VMASCSRVPPPASNLATTILAKQVNMLSTAAATAASKQGRCQITQHFSPDDEG